MASTESQTDKPIHTVILDAGPIIKGEPSVSSLLQQCEHIVTLPSVISEIRDQATRTRLETTLRPFLTLRSPSPESVKVISDFARKTGDLSVLSRTDVQLLALTYDVECERNGGDWRLRKVPGQKRTNGPPPSAVKREEVAATAEKETATNDTAAQAVSEVTSTQDQDVVNEQAQPLGNESGQPTATEPAAVEEQVNDLDDALSRATLAEEDDSPNTEEGEDSDGGEWITLSNIKRKQLEENKGGASKAPEVKTMQAAAITTDFAMQNVLLQMNLNLLSPSLQRVRHVKTFVLRCHACFNVVRDLAKQFCPRCGGATLTRVTCTTDAAGEFKIHLKKNFQWNSRGNRYSVPKPVHGSSNARVKGGGKGGWGNDLILSEDQKEYTRAVAEEGRRKQRDIMDEDYLPAILSGSRNRAGGKPQVGAGRNVNSKKR